MQERGELLKQMPSCRTEGIGSSRQAEGFALPRGMGNSRTVLLATKLYVEVSEHFSFDVCSGLYLY